MRFVYDLKTFTKRKLRTVISYPQTLDLNPYINEESKSKSDPEKNIYELTAVLIHSGPSAYGGHYTAQIRDEEYISYFSFHPCPCDSLTWVYFFF
jgi:ubiquitin carboxyl-terminal hydrolase 48